MDVVPDRPPDAPESVPEAVAAPEPRSTSASVAADTFGRRPEGWVRRLGGHLGSLTAWLRPRRLVPVARRFTKSMVQGELSLDRVQVVRNDLSDSDLEVIRTRSETKTSPRPAGVRLANGMIAAKTPLNRVRVNLFGLRKD